MPVQRVCRPDHTFRGFQGQIESGVVSVGDDIITLPSGESAKVKSILLVIRIVSQHRKDSQLQSSLIKKLTYQEDVYFQAEQHFQ